MHLGQDLLMDATWLVQEREESSKEDPQGSVLRKWRVWRGLVTEMVKGKLKLELHWEMQLNKVLLGQGNDNECSPRGPGNGRAKREMGKG